MAKGGTSVPATPNPAAISSAQGASNINTAVAQSLLDNVNQTTPYGSVNFKQTGSTQVPTGVNGQTIAVPQYSESTTLNPQAQQVYDAGLGTAVDTSNVANQIANNYQVSPLNFNTADSGILNSSPQLLDQATTNALYGQQASFLNPQWGNQQTQLEDQLSRQGIPVGSDAYSNAMDQFNNSKTQAYQSAQDSAISGGTAAAGNLFNMALSGQNENLSQQQLAQTNPLSLISQLFGASGQLPTQSTPAASQVGVSPTDVTGASALSSNAAMQAYQAQLAQQNAMFGGLASLGGSAALLAL